MSAPDPAARSLDVDAVMAQLTLEEKVSLASGADFWRTQAVERLGVPSVMVTDGPHGLRKQAGASDHVGLHDSVPATCFPPAAGLASTWDVDLLRRVGVALGDECRAEEVAVLLGPGVNMKRTPLCGRDFEYFSEDPLLAGELAAALVQGVQSRGVGTSLKHFAANNQETERMSVSVEVDERTLREIYLPAFERVVTRAQPWTVMCSYNRVNGVYASQDPWLLTRVLRADWGFEGLVVSDWGAVDERWRAVAAGLDLEMPSSGGTGEASIRTALEGGSLTQAQLDVVVRRNLELLQRVLPALAPGQTFDAGAHHALAREAARQSAVLLANDGVLPLEPASGGRLAVVGEMARSPRYQGAGSSQVSPTRLDDALTALREGTSRDVVFAPGYVTESEEADDALVAEAVEAARSAEVVVLFLGLPASYESEGYDREHLDLPASQVALLEAVRAVNDRVVVVLSNGAAVAVDAWQHHAAALLEGWLLGQAGGAATADLLYGVVSPSGRLAETVPVRLEDTPAFGAFPGDSGVVRYREGLLIGYRWYDTRRAPVSFPFGHGLSYTTFEHSDLSVRASGAGADASVEVALTVTNTGSRAGAEVVQVYAAPQDASVFRPEQELVGFARVELEPGASAPVSLVLSARDLGHWSEVHRRWVLESGRYEVRVGASSRDVRQRAVVEVQGEELVVPLSPQSEAGTWLEHPVVGPRLREQLGDAAAMLDDPQHGQMMRAIPLVRLTRFPGFPVREEDLPGMAEEAGASVGPA
ncbi:glycoside hydrolase family 3 C-terminal domain-containing protein [uncultured Pseudokineococcus sp.]|uniref:glycoside hydrolase family 3 C-terminal domain-containing protein n=1 Tax=uncultured Pseudokineococcus sp. TaxID=1642928 RepID=UPI002627AA55|nr:glycoside hydrolase family 3 C-terminal domain-containing protein [uncultured Pseudokineococcus sp.]